jgi:hypothetical protein
VVGVIKRLTRFVAGSYPPVALVDAVAWTFGQTALFAALDPRVTAWLPGSGTIVAAVTFAVDMLMMRALDDIRDLDYDKRHNPRRALASGAVRIRDLEVMCGVGGAALVVLNAGDPPAQIILATQFGYAAAAMIVDHRWHWPSGDNLLVGLAVSFPAPLLLQAYLYARYLGASHLGPDRTGALAILIVTLARLHAELARKIVWQPSAGERTYVHNFGFTGTVTAALIMAALSAALLLRLATQPWALLGLLPLWWAFQPAHQVLRGKSRRWPRLALVLFMLSTFAVYFILGITG